MRLLQRFPMRIFVWLVANTVLATLFYTFSVEEIQRNQPGLSRLAIYLDQLLQFHVISGIVAFTSYRIARRFAGRPFWQMTVMILPFSLVACIGSFFVILIGELVVYRPSMQTILHELQEGHVASSVLNSLFTTAIITVVVARLEFLEQARKRQKIAEASSKQSGQEVPTMLATSSPAFADRLVLSGRDGQSVLLHRDIVYVSSHGPVSVVHTENGEHRFPLLLKAIESELPADTFTRIHKSYLVNLQKVTNLRYDRGGSYLAYLNDAESTVLPVGRRFAAAVKGILAGAGSV